MSAMLFTHQAMLNVHPWTAGGLWIDFGWDMSGPWIDYGWTAGEPWGVIDRLSVEYG